ncbi:MAG: hypothetical protein QM783_17385 [Phycisphaerales bacterium]
MRSSYTLSALIPLCLSAAAASAQSFDIDFGTGNATPTTGYGAAAGLSGAGFWNTYPGGTMPLADLAGNPTGVSITGGVTSFPGFANDPATVGNDDALLDDFLGIPVIDTWTVTGLAAGTYDVYGYTWTFAALPSGFDVNGAGMQVAGGAWPGFYAPGLYSLHSNVTIAPNQPLVVTLYSINGAIGVISGLQIVQTPAPGAAVLLACGGLFVGRRRR